MSSEFPSPSLDLQLSTLQDEADDDVEANVKEQVVSINRVSRPPPFPVTQEDETFSNDSSLSTQISSVTLNDELDDGKKDDDKKVFNFVLSRQLRLKSQTLSFLQRKEVATIDHLCLLGQDAILRWELEDSLSSVEVGLLLALKKYVAGFLQFSDDGNSTTMWHDRLTLHALARHNTSDPHQAVSPSVYLVWVKLQCPSLSDSMNGYRQFDCFCNETYGELLLRVLAHQVSDGILPVETKVKLSTLITSIRLHSGPEDNRKTNVHARSSDSCEGVELSGKRYIEFVFPSFQKRIVTKEEVFQRLMSSQSKLCLPDKKEDPSSFFPVSLYNFLIEAYAKEEVGVTPTDIPSLEALTRDVRNALQLLYSRVKATRIPLRFRHNLQKYALKRERSSALKMKDKVKALTASTLQSSFLTKTMWAGFHEDILQLQELLHETIESHRKTTEMVQRNQQRDKRFLEDRIRCVETSEPIANPASCYSHLSRQLLEVDNYQELLITSEMIDKWLPSTSAAESNDTARQRRGRFRKNLQLSLPFRSIKFNPGGHRELIFVLWKIPLDPLSRCETTDARLQARFVDKLPRFASRQEWSSIKAKFGHALGGGLPSGVLHHLFNEFSNDDSTARDNEAVRRIVRYCIAEGNDDLYPDLRAAHSGSAVKFDAFYNFATEEIEGITGATHDRHGDHRVLRADMTKELASSHSDNMVSIPSLREYIIARMKESNDPAIVTADVPSIEMFRISCCPQRESQLIAQRYSGRFKIKRKIPQATMRKHNEDSHYNHMLNRYGNAWVLEVNESIYDLNPSLSRPLSDNGLTLSKGVTKISVDDKAAIPVGEPNLPVRSNVRKISASLIALQDTNKPNALDHDFHRANIRPSMALVIKTPAKLSDSWRHGRLIASVKEGGTQVSSPIRHAVELSRKMEYLIQDEDSKLQQHDRLSSIPEGTTKPYCLFLRSDGGSDRHPKHLSVQIAMVYLLLVLDLDCLVLEITARDVSHTNEVEGCMPVANVALQNQAFSRTQMPDVFERKYANANSGKKIREVIAKEDSPATQLACRNAWRDSLAEPRRRVTDRLRRMNYTNESTIVIEPATDEDIEQAWCFLQDKIDPTIDPKKTTKKQVLECNPVLSQFIARHVTCQRYHLECKKCNDIDCSACQKVRMPKETWESIFASRPQVIPLPIPVPVVAKGDSVKYHPYDDVKMIPSEPRHVPSFKPRSTPTPENIALDKATGISAPQYLADRNKNAKLWIPNNVRTTVQCQECNKHRCVYAWSLNHEDFGERLSHLQDVLEQPFYEYFCGDALLGIEKDEVLHHPLIADCFHVKRGVVCGMAMETHYYSSPKKFEPVCYYCGTVDNLLDTATLQTKTNGKKALPHCPTCFHNPKLEVKATGRAKHTGKPGTRKRGEEYKVTPSKPQKKRKIENITKHFPKTDVAKTTDTQALKKETRTRNDITKVVKSHFSGSVPRLIGSPFVPLQKVPENEGALDLVEAMFGAKAVDLFDIINPRGDGNCGYYVVELFNEQTGREQAMSNTQFRSQLHQWMSEHEDEILADNDYAKKHHFGSDHLNTLRQTIYQPNINCDRGCDSNMWWDQDLFAIVAQIYKCSVVNFTAGNLGPLLIVSDGVNVTSTNHIAAPADLPHPTSEDGRKNTLYVIYQNIPHRQHYIWLKPK